MMEMLLNIHPSVYLVIGVIMLSVFVLGWVQASWGGVSFMFPAFALAIALISFSFFRVSSYKQIEDHKVAQMVKENKPVICRGILIKNPQFKEFGDEVFVKLKDGTLISAYECRVLKGKK